MADRYTVLVTTAGVSSGLGELVKHTNASLIKVGPKPVLSYIIEFYPADTEFVITLGHYGDQVKEFLTIAYPERHFTFVTVDNYDGPGSSPSHSMFQAARYLQMPFIYHAGDTIVTEVPPPPNDNWVAGFRGLGLPYPQYASFDTKDGLVRAIYDKGMTSPDFLHIGLVGVHDYAKFWESAQDLLARHAANRSLGDGHTINKLIQLGSPFRVHEVATWYDTGNLENLAEARRALSDNLPILDKSEEAISFFGTGSNRFVVKFFSDEAMVRDRVARAKVLAGLVPPIEAAGRNFYRYPYVKGELYADVVNPLNFRQFLNWAEQRLWLPTDEVTPEEFKKICRNFYQKKSWLRIEQLFQKLAIEDQVNVINGETIPSMGELFARIDFDWLANSEQTRFHGDFILDNILKTEDGFQLLDWRQNFGGLIQAGDKYYDLAKLNHNLTLNHQVMADQLLTVETKGAEVTCDILRKASHVDCQQVLFEFLKTRGYDAKKVRLLTALIWLNMSPLHEPHQFLFYFGKYHLWRSLNEPSS